jgi:hypothetical protein
MTETFNPWTVVNLVFDHLAAQGLHPTLGESGDPGVPAAALLRTLGISPDVQGDRRLFQRTQDHLAALREAVFHVETADTAASGLYPQDSDER